MEKESYETPEIEVIILDEQPHLFMDGEMTETNKKNNFAIQKKCLNLHRHYNLILNTNTKSNEQF